MGFSVWVGAPPSWGLGPLGVGGTRRERNVCWPLVAVQTSLVGYLALLAHPWPGEDVKTPGLPAYGVRGIARTRRCQRGQRFNNAPTLLHVLGNNGSDP